MTEKKPKKELDLKELKKNLAHCQKLKDKYLASWKLAQADLLNYKKQVLKRVGEIIKYADVTLLFRILPILDNFELAEKKLSEDFKNDENIKGLLQIKTQLEDFLKNQKIEKIESLDRKFDPNFHEVVGEVETKDKEPGIIVQEIQKGYKLHGKVLRPAKVKVSK